MSDANPPETPLDRRSFITKGAVAAAGISFASTTNVSIAKDSESVSGPLGKDITNELEYKPAVFFTQILGRVTCCCHFLCIP